MAQHFVVALDLGRAACMLAVPPSPLASADTILTSSLVDNLGRTAPLAALPTD